MQAVKEVVVAHQANARQGTHSTKTRGEVRGGGKKPWRQKGTGRARAGSIRSPLWPGGGVVFGPKPRDYTKKINAKVKALAFSRALFDRATAGEIEVIEQFEVNPVKTKVVDQASPASRPPARCCSSTIRSPPRPAGPRATSPGHHAGGHQAQHPRSLPVREDLVSTHALEKILTRARGANGGN